MFDNDCSHQIREDVRTFLDTLLSLYLQEKKVLSTCGIVTYACSHSFDEAYVLYAD